MPLGTTHVSVKAIYDALSLLMASATLKVALMDNSVTPSPSDSYPCWGTGGTQDYSTAEPASAGNYVAGGFTLTSVGITQAGLVASLQANSPIAQLLSHASNPTGIYNAAIYDDAATPKRVIIIIDLAGPITTVNGLTIRPGGLTTGVANMFTETVS